MILFRKSIKKSEVLDLSAYLRLYVGHLLTIDQDVVKSVGGLHDQSKDRDEGQHQHLQQLDPPTATMGRIGRAGPARLLPVCLGPRNIVRRQTSHRAHFRHARTVAWWHAEENAVEIKLFSRKFISLLEFMGNYCVWRMLNILYARHLIKCDSKLNKIEDLLFIQRCKWKMQAKNIHIADENNASRKIHK